MTIAVDNDSGSAVDTDSLLLQSRFMLGALGIHPDAELSVMLVDEAEMAELHQRWMDEPGPTDVLSFPMDELRPPLPGQDPEPGVLGDVVLCPQVAARQATQAGHVVGAELGMLLTHGLLHLLGYDHAEPDENERMFALQAQLLESWRVRVSTGERGEHDRD